jgi:uncharacterized repeat protein (TIGR03803 family)
MILVLATHATAAPKYRVLHAFSKGNDGVALWGSLLLDKQGNIYGTTAAGGAKLSGTVFELTPKGEGGWMLSTLHAFDGTDGGESTAGLILDPGGRLYGTTRLGGAHGYGVVFETQARLAELDRNCALQFPSSWGCCCPYGGAAMDKTGNLYGATYSAFELSPRSDGWKATALHSFTGKHGDGSGPFAGVILDSAGNLYGTTEQGGTSKNCGGGCGTAYELRHMPDGKWKEIILHSFGSFNGDGVFPGAGALILDGTGSLYGTTGGLNSGTVYKLTPETNRWKETILYTFHAGSGGNGPGAGVVMDGQPVWDDALWR